MLTKSDLAPPDELLELYGALGVPYVVQVAVRSWRAARRWTGCASSWTARSRRSSGTPASAKTTLVNALVSLERRRSTGHVNAVTGRGRHTTTSARAIPLPGGEGWVIDTPGVRSFGLHHVDPSRVIHAFPDLEPGTEGCPRACSHDEPDCALDRCVGGGRTRGPAAALLPAPTAGDAGARGG